VWFQDELEWSTSTAPGQRIDVVIDSIRDRGLDDWAEDNVVGADQLPVVFGTGRASSQDSFGNLEVSPPVTVGGVPYPFGRIYYGANGARFGPAQGLRDALASQVVQAPFEIDTSWLCVGHVDEFMAFIPDPAAPKGFWLVWSDVDLAYDLLDRLDGDTRLPRYAPAFGGHGIRDVKELRDDAALRAYNEDVRDQDLEPILVQVLEELGLDPGDVLRIPALFEAAPGCSGAAAALIPGMVNLTVANIPGEPVKLLMADPFLRADVADQGSDPLIADMRARFPAGVELVFVDDWDTYHMALGEVHCGSNVRRTPVDGWWLSALHLLGRTP
jgi:protein-arginine deiminase